MSNYPDNIRDFDNHPQSPFYIEPEYVCEECLQAFEQDEMANDEFCEECWTKEDEE